MKHLKSRSQAVQSGNILPDEIVQQGQLMANNVNKLQEQLNNIPKLLPSVPVAQDDSEDHATIVATVFDWMGKDEGRSLRRKARNISPDEQDVDKKKPWNSWNNVFLYWSGHKEVMHKLIDEGKQVTPPKISMTGKIPSSGMAQLLNAAGIQVDPNSIQEPADEETEIIQRTPYNETKKTTTRKIS